MAGVEEPNRRRVAGGLVVTGLVLICLGAVMVFQHRQNIRASQIVYTPPAAKDSIKLANAIQIVLFYLLIFVIVFAAALVAMRRWSRNFRAWLLRPPRPQTTVEDVWVMHHPPEDLEAQEPEEPENPAPEAGPEEQR